jgi:hypothetical protein
MGVVTRDAHLPSQSLQIIMLSNEIFALDRRAYYDSIGLIVDSTNGEFAHSPLTRKECDTGYYLLHDDHQYQGLLQSRDLDKCCFFPAHAKNWLKNCDPFPSNFFELWDIYEKYASKLSKENAEKLHEKRDELGRSIAAMKFHSEKDESGKSVLAVKGAQALYASLTPEQKSERGKKAVGGLNASLTPEKRSENGRKGAEAANAALTPEQRKERSRKINAVMTPKQKSDRGQKGGKASSTQVWQSTVDGFKGRACNVAMHNKANGWDPAARVRIK